MKLIKKLVPWFFTLVVLAGICCLIYPPLSDVYNAVQQKKVIEAYKDDLNITTEKDYDEYLEEAQKYNDALYNLSNQFTDSGILDNYENILNVSGNGVMGYISIPSIDVYLPIYHGVDGVTLENATGHLQGSSLPVGGENTHSVISAHRGLMSARLFTDIDKLEIGDTFAVCVLDKVLVYKVDSILTVLPEETSALEIVEGEDYVTLQTCTPYGVNSHRLLVRGTHTDTLDADDERVKNYSIEKTPANVLLNERNLFPVILSVVLLLFFVGIRVIITIKRKGGKNV